MPHTPITRSATATCAGLALALTCLAPGLTATASAQPRPHVAWSDTSVTAGTNVKVLVSRGAVPRRGKAVLQRRYPDGWSAADRHAKEVRHGYRLDVPTEQFGKFVYRVVVRTDAGRVSVSKPKDVRIRPPYDPRGRKRAYRYLGDQRARWNSCSEIEWTFNPRHAPRHGLKQVKAGIRRIHAATGLEFDYQGRTSDAANPLGDHVRGADVVIGWRSKRTFRRYGGARVVGVGGSRSSSGYRDSQGRTSKIVQGGVILNAGFDLRSGFGRGVTWGEVIIHEVGHVVGMGHSPASNQIMYYSTTRYDASWGAGDLAGLRTLGDTRGCLHRTNGRVGPLQPAVAR